MRSTIFGIIITVFLLLSFMHATTYYVTTTGNDANDGLSESTAWRTIKHATEQISGGDTVYIKAGTYTGENVVISGGTESSPILFEGYKDSPGDVTNIDWWDYETNRELDPTKMPLLDGGNRAEGQGLQSGSYTTVRNLQITNYRNGIANWSGSHYTFENIIVTSIGDINDSYSGTGIGIYYSSEGGNTIRNCVVFNAAAEGIMVYKNDNNLLESVKVYCDDNQTLYYSNTDYYFEIESNNNLIKNCYIERVGDLDHVGHGFCIKGDGNSWEGNIFENCVAKNMEGGGFVVRHRSVTNNVFKNCTAYDATGFLIRDGASYNDFYNCKAINCNAAVRMFDTDEDDGYHYAGRYNDFYNCLFKNSGNVIDFNSYSGNSDANDNRFINCVIDGGTNLFNCNRTNYDNEIINSVVMNVTNLKSGGYSLSAIYTNTDFWNNGFTTPSGTDLLEADPLFVDAANGDYNFSENSPCIDNGTTDTTGLNLPSYDAAGNIRIVDGNEDNLAVIDMGIYEYNSTPVSILASKDAIREKFTLYNNFPNPFNPNTTIRFTLPTNTRVRLFVYNILGQKVAELINRNLTAGNYQVRFHAYGLPSGVYIYKINAGKFVAVKKMMLVK